MANEVTNLSSPLSRPSAWRRWGYATRERWLAWGLVVPAFVVVFALIFMPIVRAFWMSLHTIDLKRPGLGQPFVGLANYIDIFQDGYFWASVARTTYFMVASIAIEMVIGIAVALLLNQNFKGRGIYHRSDRFPAAGAAGKARTAALLSQIFRCSSASIAGIGSSRRETRSLGN